MQQCWKPSSATAVWGAKRALGRAPAQTRATSTRTAQSCVHRTYIAFKTCVQVVGGGGINDHTQHIECSLRAVNRSHHNSFCMYVSGATMPSSAHIFSQWHEVVEGVCHHGQSNRVQCLWPICWVCPSFFNVIPTIMACCLLTR